MNLNKKIQYKSALIGCSVVLLFLLIWTQPTIKQSGTVKIWDSNNMLLYESAGDVGKRMPVSFERLPRQLVNAIVSSEDETFWSNPGIDVRAMMRSLLINIRERKIVTGASTITQQLARTGVMDNPSRSIVRKVREIIIAIRLNIAYSKKEILSLYCNSMYFGNLAYGVESAARTYFDKDVERLSLAESALLASLLSSPEAHDPFRFPARAKTQRDYVLDLMAHHGSITSQEAVRAKEERIFLTTKKQDIKAPHFVHYVLDELDRLGIPKNEGLNIVTTLDYSAYELGRETASRWIESLREKHDITNASLVLLDNASGAVISLLGGLDYFDAVHAGQVNMALTPRQPGSALKPVIYAAAFMQGHTPATLLYDVPKVFATKTGEGYMPHNYDGKYHGLVLVREALASSLNMPAVEMLERVGLANFIETARNLGISTFTRENRYDLSLALGGGEVTLLELSNVFASFARGGQYKEPFVIRRVTTETGKNLYRHEEKKGIPALGNQSKQIAYLITDILSDPKARIPAFGEKNPLVISHPAAVKTGTTTDWHDNWTVGYTPRYTVGVWVGNTDNHPMKDITGIVGAAPIWNQFFEEFLKGKQKESFDRPTGLGRREICALSGMLPDGICPELANEWFLIGTEPDKTSDYHQKVRIDMRNGLLANQTCDSGYLAEKTYIKYPPEVYSWAKQNGLETIPQAYSPLCGALGQNNTSSFFEIIYPREKTVFEYAPQLVYNQAIVFEGKVSSNITAVTWYVDGREYKTSEVFPFSVSWQPIVGSHRISAEATTDQGVKIRGKEIHISVVEFHGGND